MSITNKIQKNIILHNIRSVLNVGAIFRTADAIGIVKVYISGHTPAPIDRFGRERNDIKKTALGAEKSVEWEEIEDIYKLIDKLKKEEHKIIALEQSEKSIDYKEVKKHISGNVTIILGSETKGVDQKVLDQSDFIAEIPMMGEKESLNVSVATGILLYSLFDN